MKELSDHFKQMRQQYPEDNLMIVFDIDDTIVDVRIPLLYVLKKYDAIHDTRYFEHFTIDDIVFEEWKIQNWLKDGSPIDDPEEQQKVLKFVRDEMWQDKTILLSHRPFHGVLEIIRWFQLQNNVEVGLNTGRSEELREITLKSLNTLGREFRVEFSPDLLYMNPLPNEEGKDVTSYKARGIKYFENKGYRVIAFIDNEPANLSAVSHELEDDELMLLHADTMFTSSRELRPEQAISGDQFEITEIIDPDELPEHIEFVWNGVNSFDILKKYKQSNVHWGEVDVRFNPLDQSIILKHGSFDGTSFNSQGLITFQDMLQELKQLDRGIKIVMKEDDGLLDAVISVLEKEQVTNHLWFDIIFEIFDNEGLEKIKSHFPDAIISTRVDFLVPLLSQFPEFVEQIITELVKHNITVFSISLKTYNKDKFIQFIDEDMGYDINIRDVYSFEQFLRASILLPKSIVSNFDY